MAFCEILPRRNSGQISDLNKTKIRKCLYLIKKEKKKTNLDLRFFLKAWEPKNEGIYKKITFPFGHRIKLKKIFLITKKKCKKKGNEFGKYMNSIDFEKKLRNGSVKSSNFRKFFILFEKNTKERRLKFLENFFLKNHYNLTYFNFNKNLYHSMFKSLSFFWNKTTRNFLYTCKIPSKNCIQKSLNNIVQIFGNILDFLPKGISSVRKISIKYEKMPNFQILTFD